MGRVPIPKPSFLDDCEYLGYIYGERRWRGSGGLLFTWYGFHGEIEASDSEDVTGTSPIPSLAAPSGLPLKGEAFVSDVHTKPPAFMTLYEQGLATAEQADNAVEAWHESGDDEQRSLSEYLGMSETEYDVWCMAPDALPIILRARREPTPLRDLLALTSPNCVWPPTE